MSVCMCAHAWECEHISMCVCSWVCVSVHEKATWQSQHRCHLKAYHPPLFQTESFTGLGSPKELDCWPMSLRDAPASASQCWVYKRMPSHTPSHMPLSYAIITCRHTRHHHMPSSHAIIICAFLHVCWGLKALALGRQYLPDWSLPPPLRTDLCSRSGCHLLSTELSWRQDMVFISNV